VDQRIDIGAYERGSGVTPSLSVADVSVAEGNSGTTSAVFTVSLSPAATGTVSVDYATANGTATAGSDYVAQSGNLSFAVGQTTRTISIAVNADTTVEPNGTFFVNLSNPSGATLADARGQGTIRNDDTSGTPPELSISDTIVVEGNRGARVARFRVRLSAASASAVSVAFATADGTATAGSDYVARAGTLTFPAGATLADGQGRGTIRDDDHMRRWFR
jgi:ribosomal protein L35AE/L33A